MDESSTWGWVRGAESWAGFGYWALTRRDNKELLVLRSVQTCGSASVLFFLLPFSFLLILLQGWA